MKKIRNKPRRKNLKSLFFAFLILVFCSSCSLEEKDGRYAEASSLSGKANFDEKNSAWTILVYMAADNELESAAISDLNEMENVCLPDSLNLLVLLDRSGSYDSSNGDWEETRLYKVAKDEKLNKNLIASETLECEELEIYFSDKTELDMGNEKNLSGFLKFARRRYRSDNYALVIWGHGAGWRGFVEDETNSSYMSLSHLRSGIENGMDGEKLAFLGFDTCFASTFEVAYEMLDCAQIMAGTPGIASEYGWDYFALMSGFIDGGLTLDSLCSACKNQFQLSYENYKYGAFSVLDLSKIRDAFLAFKEFSEIAAFKINDLEIRNEIFRLIENDAVSYMAAKTPTDFYIDVFSLAKILVSVISDDKLSALEINLRKKIGAAILDSWNVACSGCSLSVFFNVYKSPGIFSLSHEPLYVGGSREIETCGFVSDCVGYVPSADCNGSLLDKLFYTIF